MPRTTALGHQAHAMPCFTCSKNIDHWSGIFTSPLCLLQFQIVPDLECCFKTEARRWALSNWCWRCGSLAGELNFELWTANSQSGSGTFANFAPHPVPGIQNCSCRATPLTDWPASSVSCGFGIDSSFSLEPSFFLPAILSNSRFFW